MHDRRTIALAHAVAALCVLLPIAVTETPPLVDFPKTVAVMRVLQETATSPDLASNFVVLRRFTPYLGVDLLSGPLLAAFSPLVGARVLLGASLVLTGLTPAVLHRALHGRVEAWPLLAWLVVYHHAVFWGFFNFVLAVPLILAGFGLWLLSNETHPGLRAAALTAVAAVLMTVHLIAWGAFGLLLLGGLVPAVRARQWSAVAWSAVPFGMTFLAWRLLPGPPASEFTLFNPDRIYQYGTLMERARDLTSPFNYDYLASDVVLVTLGMSALYWMAREQLVVVHPRARWPLIFTAIGSLLMPQILLGSWGTLRLPVLGVLVLLATSSPSLASVTTLRRIAVLAALAFALRTGQLTASFSRCDAVFAELRTALQAIPPGEAVVPVLGSGEHPSCGRRPVFSHVSAFATIDGSAFSHQVLGYPNLYPTERRKPLAGLLSPLIPEALDAHTLQVIDDHADFVLDIHFGQPVDGFERYPAVREGEWFSLRAVSD